jgi:HEAT repeat protein
MILILGCMGVWGCRGQTHLLGDFQEKLLKEDWLSNQQAVDMLAQHGQQALPLLLTLQRHKSPHVRMLVAVCLRHFAEQPIATHLGEDTPLAALVKLLRDRDPLVRRRAAESLIAFDMLEKSAIASDIALDLVDKRDKDSEVRHYVALAFGNLQKSSDSVLRNLFSQINTSEPLVAIASAYSFLRLADLSDKEQNISPSVKQERAEQIQQAWDILLHFLKCKDAWLQSSAALTLGKLQTKAQRTIPKLLDVLIAERSDPMVQHNVAVALAKMGQIAYAEIQKKISHPSPLVRTRVAYAFSQMHALSAKVTASLKKWRSNKAEKDQVVLAMIQFAIQRLEQGPSVKR